MVKLQLRLGEKILTAAAGGTAAATAGGALEAFPETAVAVGAGAVE